MLNANVAMSWSLTVKKYDLYTGPALKRRSSRAARCTE